MVVGLESGVRSFQQGDDRHHRDDADWQVSLGFHVDGRSRGFALDLLALNQRGPMAMKQNELSK